MFFPGGIGDEEIGRQLEVVLIYRLPRLSGAVTWFKGSRTHMNLFIWSQFWIIFSEGFAERQVKKGMLREF